MIFLFRTPKQRANKASELVSEKNSPGKRTPINSSQKKKNIPSKAKKILHLRLPINKKKTTKRFHKLKESYKIDYKWITKVRDILYCKRCSKFPKLHHRKNTSWYTVGKEIKTGSKRRCLLGIATAIKKIAHNECQQYYDRIISRYTKVSSVYPDVTTFTTQISNGLNDQLRAKLSAQM